MSCVQTPNIFHEGMLNWAIKRDCCLAYLRAEPAILSWQWMNDRVSPVIVITAVHAHLGCCRPNAGVKLAAIGGTLISLNIQTSGLCRCILRHVEYGCTGRLFRAQFLACPRAFYARVGIMCDAARTHARSLACTPAHRWHNTDHVCTAALPRSLKRPLRQFVTQSTLRHEWRHKHQRIDQCIRVWSASGLPVAELPPSKGVLLEPMSSRVSRVMQGPQRCPL